MNADLETNPSHVALLIDSVLKNDADMVVASRWAKGAHFDLKSYGYTKALLNYVFQFFFRSILRMEITDLTFCFKIAKSKMLKNIRWRGERHEFAMETTVVPILMGFRVKEIPTSWVARSEGVSNYAFKRNIRHLSLILVIIFDCMRGRLREVYASR
jgi:dolichol-phosphate mannosyltransferase